VAIAFEQNDLFCLDSSWGFYCTHYDQSCCNQSDARCRFRGNEVRLRLSILACNLGNLRRRLALPAGISNWSLTSPQQQLMKTGGRLVKHARYYWLMLAEGHLTRVRFSAMLRRIALLPLPTN
jgi:hypothetical protein